MNQPLANLTFIAFDTETTGLNPAVCKLVELSGVKFRLQGEIISTFSQLINPETEIPEDLIKLHGITNEMVKNEPTIASVVPAFLNWIDDDQTILVAHNAPFDIGFLQAAISHLQQPMPKHKVIDTLTLARALVPQARNHKLQTLTEHFKIESTTYHRALADSYHVRGLLTMLIALIPDLDSLEMLYSRCRPLSFYV